MKRYLTFFFLLITSIALCAYPEGAINNIDGSALGWDETNQVWRPISVDANGNLKTDSSGATQEISVDTSNIETYLKTMDGENTVTISDLINGIGTDTKDIKNDLEVDDKTVTELVNGIGTDTKNIESYLKTDVGSPNSPDIKNISELIASVFKAYDSNYNGGLTVQYLLNTINSTVNGIAYVLGGNIGTDVGAIKTETSAISKQPSEFRTTRLSNISANTATQINIITDLNSLATHREFIELRAIDPDTEFYIGFANTLTDSNGRPVKGRILLSMPSTQALYIYHANSSAIDVQQTEGWR